MFIMANYFNKKVTDPDIGYDCDNRKMVKLWWDKPKHEKRCEAQIHPLRDSMGRHFICRCQMKAVETRNGVSICKRHVKMADQGRLKLFSEFAEVEQHDNQTVA